MLLVMFFSSSIIKIRPFDTSTSSQNGCVYFNTNKASFRNICIIFDTNIKFNGKSASLIKMHNFIAGFQTIKNPDCKSGSFIKLPRPNRLVSLVISTCGPDKDYTIRMTVGSTVNILHVGKSFCIVAAVIWIEWSCESIAAAACLGKTRC